MKWRSFALFAVIAGCAHNPLQPDDLRAAKTACAAGASHVEVQASGVVDSVLGVRSSSSGSHEGFRLLVRGIPNGPAPADAAYKIEDNVDLTGYIPLRRGDAVELMGQFECNDSVIHWTHHDPAGRHPAGYIKVNGRTYR